MRLKGFNTMTRYIDDDTVGAADFKRKLVILQKEWDSAIFGAADFAWWWSVQFIEKNVSRGRYTIAGQTN